MFKVNRRQREDAALAGVSARAGYRGDRRGADRTTYFHHAGCRAEVPRNTGSSSEVEGDAAVQFRGAVPLVLHTGVQEGCSAERAERIAAAGSARTFARRLEREGLHQSGDHPEARRRATQTGARQRTYARSRLVLLYLLWRTSRRWCLGLAL